MLTNEELEHLRNNKELITKELLDALRITKQGKAQALDILDLPKDEEEYYLDAFGSRLSFHGDRLLKKQYTKLKLSPIHLDELARCYSDIRYFRDNYVRIRTPLDGVNFPDLRPYQNQIIEELQSDDEQYIILSPRQCVTGDTRVGHTTIGQLFNSGSHPVHSDTFYCDSVLTYEKIRCQSGWHQPLEILRTIPLDVYQLTFSNGTALKCSPKHHLIQEDGTEVPACNALNKKFKTIDGSTMCIAVDDLGYKEPMYDVCMLHDHLYYTNGILSHNSGKSITIATWLAWLYCFSKDIVIGICANKLGMAIEFLKNTKDILVQLPVWMTPGCKVWNVGSIGGDNGVRILTDSPSDSSFRGFSCNVIIVDECISGESIINIKETITGESRDMTIEHLYNINERKKHLVSLFAEKIEGDITEYIDFCLFHDNPDVEGEIHHILPRSLFPELVRSKANLVNLSIKHHIQAHGLLAKALPHIREVVFPYNAMMCWHNEDIESCVELRNIARRYLSEVNIGIVTAVKDGKVVKISKDEFWAHRDEYSTPSDGMITVTDRKTGERIRIQTCNYDKTKHAMHNTGFSTWYNPKTGERTYANSKPDGWVAGPVLVSVMRDGELITIRASKVKPTDNFVSFYTKPPEVKMSAKRRRQTKEELARKAKESHIAERKEMFAQAGLEYKRGKHLKKGPRRKGLTSVRLADGSTTSMPVAEARANGVPGVTKGITAIIVDGSVKRISKSDFDPTKHTLWKPKTTKCFRVSNGMNVIEGILTEITDIPKVKNQIRRAAISGNIIQIGPFAGYKAELIC